MAVRNLAKARLVELPDHVVTHDAGGVVDDPEVDLVVEVIGGHRARPHPHPRRRKAGKPVVSANKEPLASMGAEIFDAADAAGVDVLFEAAVAGAIPHPLLRGVARRRAHHLVMGIVNGTTNYILTRMTERAPPTRRPRRGPEPGLLPSATPPPTWRASTPAPRPPSSPRSPSAPRGRRRRLPRGHLGITAADIDFARHLGYVVKLLGGGRGRRRRDRGAGPPPPWSPPPTRWPRCASFNAVFIEGDAIGELMLYGRGPAASPRPAPCWAT